MGLSASKGYRSDSAWPSDDRQGLAARKTAARLLSAVVDSGTSLDGLTDRGNGHPDFRKLDARDQSLVKAILVTALRRRGMIEAVLSSCLDRPLPPRAASLKTILHTAAAQILFLDVPDSASVDLAVTQASQDPRTARFSALVNALLRRVSREKDQFLVQFDDPLIDMPIRLRERLLPVYGSDCLVDIARAHHHTAPIDLSARGDPAELASRVGGLLLPFGTVRLAPGQGGAISDLPGFAEGEWWVQDAAARLPALLFGDVAGRSIADVCAAPGGKSMQLASAGARVTSVDISANRMKRLTENMARLRLTVATHVGDLREWQPAQAFDGVLVDAPCSSTGTIRRHPDVAYTKSADEIGKLALVQAGLLGAAARLVRPGGTLVFSNCSLDPQEGEAMIGAFLAANSDFCRVPVEAAELPGLEAAIDANGDVRTTPAMLPHDNPSLGGLDGFFASRLQRRQAVSS